MAGLFSRNSIMTIDANQDDLVKGNFVSGKVTQVVPAHGVDVGLANFLGKLSMMSG